MVCFPFLKGVDMLVWKVCLPSFVRRGFFPTLVRTFQLMPSIVFARCTMRIRILEWYPSENNNSLGSKSSGTERKKEIRKLKPVRWLVSKTAA